MSTSRIQSILVFASFSSIVGCSAGTNRVLGDGGQGAVGQQGDGGTPTGRVSDGGRTTDAPPGIYPGADDASAANPNSARVFVTRAVYTADALGSDSGDGLGGADGLCATAAASANLGGTWAAWISNSLANAIDRITGPGPWYLVDRMTLVFPNRASLAGLPTFGIVVDEFGAEVKPPHRVWTGTATGGRASRDNCDNWRPTSFSSTGMIGIADQAEWWTGFIAEQCLWDHALYCFELK